MGQIQGKLCLFFFFFKQVKDRKEEVSREKEERC